MYALCESPSVLASRSRRTWIPSNQWSSPSASVVAAMVQSSTWTTTMPSLSQRISTSRWYHRRPDCFNPYNVLRRRQTLPLAS